MPLETYYRSPSKSEIKFGYGCLHYCVIPSSHFLKANGIPKKWCMYGGCRWYLV